MGTCNPNYLGDEMNLKRAYGPYYLTIVSMNCLKIIGILGCSTVFSDPFFNNIGKTNVSKKTHGFQTMWLGARNALITLVLPMFFEGWSRKNIGKTNVFKKLHGPQSMWLGARRSWITLGLPMFLKDGTGKTSVKHMFSKNSMVFNPCGWEHDIHG